MNSVVTEWLSFAKADLLAAKRLIDEAALSTIACFHCQQCVEKCLKAIVEANGDTPPKIHDLVRLDEIAGGVLDVEEEMLARLNEVYIDSRYPAGLGFLPEGAPSVEDAREFLEFAERVFHATEVYLGDD